MCGRYRLTRADRHLLAGFGVEPEEELAPRYNIAPTQDAPVVRMDHAGERKLAMQRWGLVPHWAADVKVGAGMINARAESLLEKPAFREPFFKRRCLVLADGFYEWKKEGKQKRPFCFTLQDGSVFAFAGVWDRWRTPQGAWLESFSIVTTTPNTLAKAVHDRMPVILPAAHHEAWLSAPGTEALQSLLAPFESEKMKNFPVSEAVNSYKNDGPECVAPIVEEPRLF